MKMGMMSPMRRSKKAEGLKANAADPLQCRG